jgi:hypothetical protein
LARPPGWPTSSGRRNSPADSPLSMSTANTTGNRLGRACVCAWYTEGSECILAPGKGALAGEATMKFRIEYCGA